VLCYSNDSAPPNAALFATPGFWQGVDVPAINFPRDRWIAGRSSVRQRPIGAARFGLADEGRNPFSEFQVPESVLALKQGCGAPDSAPRPTARAGPAGSRIQRIPYCKIFLSRCPGYRRTNDLCRILPVSLFRASPAEGIVPREEEGIKAQLCFKWCGNTFSSGHDLRGYTGSAIIPTGNN